MTKKEIEIEIRAGMITDLLNKTNWAPESIAHIFGHRAAKTEDLKKAIEIHNMSSLSRLRYWLRKFLYGI